MITKVEFLKAIDAMKKQSEIDDNFDTHMSAAFPGSYAPIYENELWTLSVHLLELLMEDPYEYVDWWIWETNFGKREDLTTVSWEENGLKRSANLNTPEALYDFLKECAEQEKFAQNASDSRNAQHLT